jgi:hypothetical protein
MLWCVLYIQDFILFSGKKLKSQFLVVNIRVPQANCLWVDFDKIWQFWADSADMVVVDSMPSFEREIKKTS